MVKSGRPDCKVDVMIADCSNRLCDGQNPDSCCLADEVEDITTRYLCDNGESFPVTVSVGFCRYSLHCVCVCVRERERVRVSVCVRGRAGPGQDYPNWQMPDLHIPTRSAGCDEHDGNLAEKYA